MEALAAEGTAEADRSLVAGAEIDHRGQHHEVSVPFDPADLAPERLDRIAADFHRLHERLYGFSSPDRPLETIALRVSVRGKRGRTAAVPSQRDERGAADARLPARLAPRTRRSAEVPVLDADAMLPRYRFAARRWSRAPTTMEVVPEAYDLVVDASSSFVLDRKGPR